MAKKPTILGYSAGTKLRIGDSLELICRSCDPYPNTTVHWYEMNVRKDLLAVGARIGRDGACVERRLYIGIWGSFDDGRRFRCAATIDRGVSSRDVTLSVGGKLINLRDTRLEQLALNYFCFVTIFASLQIPKQTGN